MFTTGEIQIKLVQAIEEIIKASLMNSQYESVADYNNSMTDVFVTVLTIARKLDVPEGPIAREIAEKKSIMCDAIAFYETHGITARYPIALEPDGSIQNPYPVGAWRKNGTPN